MTGYKFLGDLSEMVGKRIVQVRAAREECIYDTTLAPPIPGMPEYNADHGEPVECTHAMMLVFDDGSGIVLSADCYMRYKSGCLASTITPWEETKNHPFEETLNSTGLLTSKERADFCTKVDPERAEYLKSKHHMQDRCDVYGDPDVFTTIG